jgi:hypothetical protein
LDAATIDGVEEIFPGGYRDMLLVFGPAGSGDACGGEVERPEEVDVGVAEVN